MATQKVKKCKLNPKYPFLRERVPRYINLGNYYQKADDRFAGHATKGH